MIQYIPGERNATLAKVGCFDDFLLAKQWVQSLKPEELNNTISEFSNQSVSEGNSCKKVVDHSEQGVREKTAYM